MPVGIAALMSSSAAAEPWRARLRLAFGIGFMLVLMPWLRVIGSDAWIALRVIEGSSTA